MIFFARRLLVLLLLLPVSAAAQDQPAMLSKKSIPHLMKGWRFCSGDDKAFAATDYNDSAWAAVASSEMMMDQNGKNLFTGICWMRTRFAIDTVVAGRPLLFEIRQTGASEIYLDGKRLRTYGSIHGKDSSEYENPQSDPLVFTAAPGPHVLAVRYANWPVVGSNPIYRNGAPGFSIRLAEANSAVSSMLNQVLGLGAIMMTLFGVFIALFLLHLILFLYNRGDRSNLSFSLFSLCVALLFAMPVITLTSSDPGLIQTSTYCILIVLVLTFFSLSGFLNYLFARKRLRFNIIRGMSVLAVLLYFYSNDAGYYALSVLAVTVTVEAIVIIIAAIVRRRPGARIIGAGLLLLILVLLTLLIAAFINHGLNLNPNETFGSLILLLLVVAILSIPISLSAFLARNFAVVSKDLKKQLAQVQELSQKTLEQEAEKQRLLESRKEELEKEVAARTAEVVQQHEALKIEKKKSDDLLLNILPEEVAEELKETGASVARLYENVSVLFTDFVDFTQHSEKLSPAALVTEIDTCFKAFDGIIGTFGLEKIKTVGDAYIAVSGLPVTELYHARAVLGAALAIRDYMVQRKAAMPDTFDIRLGIHSGPVVAGIVGVKKFAYDIWGDTVNTAARMEQASEAGRVNISATTYELVKDDFACEYRGELEAKHKGRMGMYFAGAKK